MEKIRILGIAPYEAMKMQMIKLVEEFKEIDLIPFTGDLQEGLEIAQANFHGNFDMVISRGATADLLREELSIPVIGVEISTDDILHAMNLANASNKKVAIVSVADVSQRATQIASIIGCTLECYRIPSSQEATEILKKCKNYHAVLCDMFADKAARELGLNSFLITSSDSSVRNTFIKAIDLYKSMRTLKNENSLLRTLFISQIGKTIVFDSNKHVLLSSLEDMNSKIIDMLKPEIEDLSSISEKKLVRIRDGIIYSIRAKSILIDSNIYYAFFYTERKNAYQMEKPGIKFLATQEIESKYYSSLFFLAGTANLIKTKIEKTLSNNIPILIYGENGTGKESLAYYIYLNCNLKYNPFIHIDCSLINDKSWDYLMNHTTSPLSTLDQTLYLSNINKLDKKKISSLLSILRDINESNRNRIIFSSTTEKLISETDSLFLDVLNAVSIKTPELRSQKDSIPSLFNRLLSLLNMEFPHQLVGATNEALNIIKEYPWPNNFSQFKRFTKELIINSNEPIANAQTVKETIEKEKLALYVSDSEMNKPISLNQSLKSIEKEIAKKVLEEEGGNQSATAKRLQISRTTLWRMLNEQ